MITLAWCSLLWKWQCWEIPINHLQTILLTAVSWSEHYSASVLYSMLSSSGHICETSLKGSGEWEISLMRDGTEQHRQDRNDNMNVYLALFELMHYRIRALGRLKLILQCFTWQIKKLIKLHISWKGMPGGSIHKDYIKRNLTDKFQNWTAIYLVELQYIFYIQLKSVLTRQASV